MRELVLDDKAFHMCKKKTKGKTSEASHVIDLPSPGRPAGSAGCQGK